MLEANADHQRARTIMLDRSRQAIAGTADWNRMADFALDTAHESLGLEAGWMLAGPNFKHGTPTEQIANAERVVDQMPKLVTIYAERALNRVGVAGSPELASWALPRVHDGQRQSLIDHHIGRWAKRDREAVAGWAGTLEAGELRQMVDGVLAGVPASQ